FYILHSSFYIRSSILLSRLDGSWAIRTGLGVPGAGNAEEDEQTQLRLVIIADRAQVTSLRDSEILQAEKHLVVYAGLAVHVHHALVGETVDLAGLLDVVFVELDFLMAEQDGLA